MVLALCFNIGNKFEQNIAKHKIGWSTTRNKKILYKNENTVRLKTSDYIHDFQSHEVLINNAKSLVAHIMLFLEFSVMHIST